MFIDSIRIDREALAQSGSYVANLPFVRSLPDGVIPISSPVTFFVGENGSGKSTLLEAVAIAAGLNPEGEVRIFFFPPETAILTCGSIFAWLNGRISGGGTVIFCVRRASITWHPTSMGWMQNRQQVLRRLLLAMAEYLCINSRMEKVLWRWLKTGLVGMGCTYWMNRKLRCHLPA